MTSFENRTPIGADVTGLGSEDSVHGIFFQQGRLLQEFGEGGGK